MQKFGKFFFYINLRKKCVRIFHRKYFYIIKTNHVELNLMHFDNRLICAKNQTRNVQFSTSKNLDRQNQNQKTKKQQQRYGNKW